ncbi:MAG: glycosyltransferase [Pseudomonadota bacterium]
MDAIPRIIHQTWHSPIYRDGKGTPHSWTKINPEWDYKLWLDDDLEPLVREHRPDILDLFGAAPSIVQKTDLARYVMLWTFGGIYVDIDTDCLSSLQPLTQCQKAVFCEEPPEHAEPAHMRGMERLWCNAVMASPAKHPFWDHLFAMIRHNRHAFARDVLESTGPLILSAAIETFCGGS